MAASRITVAVEFKAWPRPVLVVGLVAAALLLRAGRRVPLWLAGRVKFQGARA